MRWVKVQAMGCGWDNPAHAEPFTRITDSRRPLEVVRCPHVVLDKLGKLARPLSYIAMLASAVWGLVTVVKGGGK